MTAQSNIRVANHGATVFNNEASWFTATITDPDTAVDDKATKANRVATYQYAILPILDRIKTGKIDVPTKEECLNQTKLVCVGASSWKGIYMNDGTSHTRESGDVFPKEGRYGLTPILPATLDSTALTSFQTKLSDDSRIIAVLNDINPEIRGMVEAAPTDNTSYQIMLDNLYEKEYITSNTYINRVGKTWWWYGWNENGGAYESRFEPKEVQANWLQINSGQYAYGVVTEKSSENKLNIYLNNYRIDKTALNGFTGDMGGAPSPTTNWWYDAKYQWGASPEAYKPQMRTRKWINQNLTVQLENGNPVIEGSGRDAKVKTAAGTNLKDDTLYTSVIQVKGTYQGQTPQIIYNNKNQEDSYSKYYNTQESWNADTQILTVTIEHNGQVDFDILVDAKSSAQDESTNLAGGKQVTTSGSYTTGEGSRPISWITDGRFYPSTIVMVSDDPNFAQEAETKVLFNSCSNPQAQSWSTDTPLWVKDKAGTDQSYNESSTGKTITTDGTVSGRYVRIYSRTNDDRSGDNHFVEVEVWGK